MNRYHRYILKYIAKKIVRQSHEHEENIIEYYDIMRESAHKEFTEDSHETVDVMLEDCFEDTQEDYISEDLNFLGKIKFNSTKETLPYKCNWKATYIAIVLGMLIYTIYLIARDNYFR